MTRTILQAMALALFLAVWGTMCMVAIGGCDVPPPKQTNDVAIVQVTTECIRGCQRLRDLGCPEGDMDCAAVCQRVLDAHLSRLDPAQWLDAGADALIGVRCVK